MGPNVTLSRPFYIGATEVTLGQYRRFMPGHRVDGADAEFKEDDRPAAMVSWDDARAFCAWLSDQADEKKEGRTYALPTEAQWEWATRAGSATPVISARRTRIRRSTPGSIRPTLPTRKRRQAAAAGIRWANYPPNAWGLHDTLGNAWKWCADRRTDPATGENRDPVMRGGHGGPEHSTARRSPMTPPRRPRRRHTGFRIARTVTRAK